MTSIRGIAPLLQPYFDLPPELSTILLTNVLGASANWLVERYIIAALSRTTGGLKDTHAGGHDIQESSLRDDAPISVVLVSWMREFETWRTEIRKAAGLDLNKFAIQKRFVFVDGLTGLIQSSASPKHEQVIIPSTIGSSHNGAAPPAGALNAEEAISKAIGLSKSAETEPKVLLLLDQPDVILATQSSPTAGSSIPSLLAEITALSRQVHATVVSVGISAPLIAPASIASTRAEEDSLHAFSPLDANHAAFVTSLAHRANRIFQLRTLDTGWASDVSGVLRISRGGAWSDDEQVTEASDATERELLYYVKGDGAVNVFERGAYNTS